VRIDATYTPSSTIVAQICAGDVSMKRSLCARSRICCSSGSLSLRGGAVRRLGWRGFGVEGGRRRR
jgi:hypothetical protein